MFPDSGYVDLLHQNWKVEDFNNYSFTATETIEEAPSAAPGPKKKMTKIFFEKVIPQKGGGGGWFAGVTESFKHLVYLSDSKNFFKIKDAFDTLVKGELDNQNKVLLQNENTPAENQLRILQTCLEELDTLQRNLLNHNEVIQNYNKDRFYTSALACSSHKQNLLKIAAQREKLFQKGNVLKGLAQSPPEQARQRFEQTFAQLQQNINEGQKIDRFYVQNAYHPVMDLLRTMDGRTAEDSIHRYHTLINRAYIENLIDSIKNKRMTLPKTIGILLSNLGFPPEWIQEKGEMGAKALVEILENYLRNPDFLARIPGPQLIERVEGEVFALTIKYMGLNENQHRNLSLILNHLYRFEIEWEKRSQEFSEQAKKAIIESFSDDAAVQPLIQNMVASFQLPSTLPLALKQLLEDKAFQKKHLDGKELVFNIKMLDASQEEIGKFVNCLDILTQVQHGKHTYNRTLDRMFESLISLSQKPAQAWLNRNERFKVFEFNQGQWGEQYILGKGACGAINYRWIKNLLLNPHRKIRDVQDFEATELLPRDQSLADVAQRAASRRKSDPLFQELLRREAAERYESTRAFAEVFGEEPLPSAPEGSDVLVTSGDRALQAKQKLATYFGEHDITIDASTLRRDGIVVRSAIDKDFPKVMPLLEAILAKHNHDLFLNPSSGIIEIYIANKSKNEQGKIEWHSPHVVGIQIDQMHGVFRFWDVNNGMYAYSNLNDLKREMADYMETFYGKHNYFYGSQYFPKSAKT